MVHSDNTEPNPFNLIYYIQIVNNKQTSSGFGRLFKRNKESESNPEQKGSSSETSAQVVQANTIEQGLNKSSSSLLSKIGDVFKGTFDLEDELFEDLEEVLMSCDIGVKASLGLVDNLRDRVEREKIKDAAGVITGLRSEIAELLSQGEQDWAVTNAQLQQQPYVILMVGVNGVGKTTTTAKIAYKLKQQGKSVMLAAADTFRAAAVEQLQSWGEKLDIPVIAQQHGADAAAVAHDALTSALARNIDVLLIDTAGRLHTQSDLMEQLQKVTRVLKKANPAYPHEVMQILDAGTGQNALVQLEHFQKAVGVSSICLTKLDGSAKGGVAIALTQQYKLPIRFIGIGESFDDLQPFNAQSFAHGLISDQTI
ncbi:UNVERIFIED_CONTAM: hypothetical protein GTU68_045327 [Idotea baltica]|nr:hypothetical protein [Idotea baltica]